MKQWVGLGKFLAGHMQIIVPICVALGVLFPQQIGVLKPIVSALFAFMTFQGALSNTFHQVAEVFHRPLHLILALLVSAVLIPIAAYAIGSLFFGSNPNLVCGIVLEYSAPWPSPLLCGSACSAATAARAHHHPDVLSYLPCDDSAHA